MSLNRENYFAFPFQNTDRSSYLLAKPTTAPYYLSSLLALRQIFHHLFSFFRTINFLTKKKIKKKKITDIIYLSLVKRKFFETQKSED